MKPSKHAQVPLPLLSNTLKLNGAVPTQHGLETDPDEDDEDDPEPAGEPDEDDDVGEPDEDDDVGEPDEELP